MATSDKPAPVLDLDALEAHTSETRPFTVRVDGKDIPFRSLDDLGWDAVEDLRNDFNLRDFFFEVIESDDDLDLFFGKRFKHSVVQRIVVDYFKHYGMTAPQVGDPALNRAARRARRR